MDTVESFDSAPPYDLLVPITQTVPFVFGSPHSGTSYPRAFWKPRSFPRSICADPKTPMSTV
jgi:N-formylglutamate amidohydrolase